MSTDGRYILGYESLPYTDPTPQDQDIQFLMKEYPRISVIYLDYDNTIYFEPPKYRVLPDHIDKLQADQVFERLDGELWNQIKGL